MGVLIALPERRDMSANAPQPAMLNQRRLPERVVAGVRWRLFFWLFAVFAGVEAPLGAAEATSGRSGFVSTALKALDSHNAIAGLPGTAIEAPRVDLDETSPAVFETRVFDSGGPDGLAHGSGFDAPDRVRDAAGATPTRFAFAHHAAGFSSRAPPHAA
jgi:hypothetical protein